MANKNLWIRKFDRDRDFTVRRAITVGNVKFGPGDPFDKTLVPTRRLRQMYDQRVLMFTDTAPSSLAIQNRSPGDQEYIEHQEDPPINPENAQNDSEITPEVIEDQPSIEEPPVEEPSTEEEEPAVVNDQPVLDEEEPELPQLDHDNNGEPGGSLPDEERGLEELKAEAEKLGVEVDGRWGEKRLEKEIEKAKAARS